MIFVNNMFIILIYMIIFIILIYIIMFFLIVNSIFEICTLNFTIFQLYYPSDRILILKGLDNNKKFLW